MPDLDNPTEDTDNAAHNLSFLESDVFDAVHIMVKYKNQRKSVRYVRKDITAFISQADIFGTYSLFSYSRAIKVKLIDISSRGALIGGPSSMALKINQKIMLTLIFSSNRKFEFPSTVKREITQERTFYGLKFDAVSDTLGEYLLESQSDLVFKWLAFQAPPFNFRYGSHAFIISICSYRLKSSCSGVTET